MTDYTPDTRVEFAFGADPNTTPVGGWTDVTADLESGQITPKHGRQDEQDQVQAESWSFQLRNDHGHYTPDLPTSPHYPNLKLGLPCRVRVGGDVRGIGNVVEISPRWPAGDIESATSDGWSMVTVAVSGFLRRLGQGEEPLSSALTRSWTRRADIVAYWPGEEGADATLVSSPIQGVAPIRPLGVEFGAGQDHPAGSAPAAIRVPEGGGRVLGAVPSHPSTASYVASCVMFVAGLDATSRVLLNVASTGRAVQWRVAVNSTNVVFTAIDSDGSSLVNNTVAVSPLLAGRWLFIQIGLGQSGSSVSWSYTIRTADVELTTINQNSGTLSSATLGRVTNIGMGPGIAGVNAPDRYISHIALMRRDIGAPVTVFNAAVIHGYTGERAAMRLERLCHEEGMACTIIGDPDTSMPMGPQRIEPLTTLWQEAAATDGGILAEQRDAFGFVYRCRTDLYNQGPALELDAGTFPGDITHPFEPTLDDQHIQNDITVQQDGGTAARAVDEEDIADRDRYVSSDTVNVARSGLLELIANWRLHLGTHPGMRYSSLSPALMQKPSLIPDWVATRLGDRIVVTGLPSQHPPDPVDLLMQGYTDVLAPTSWTAEANTTPARPWNVFEVEHATFGRVWSPRPYLGEDIDDDDTSFDVVVPVQRALNGAAPDFETEFTAGATDDFDWRTFDISSFTQSSDLAFTGRYSGRIVPDGAHADAEVRSSTRIGTATPTRVYRASAWVRPPGSGIEARVILHFLRPGTTGPYTLTAQHPGPFVALAPNTWTRLSASASAMTASSPAALLAATSALRISVQYLRADAGTLATDLFVDDAEIGAPGAPFTTDSGDFPLDIIVGGERMTVTAIGADDGTGKQTFTVTRSVNGVTKAHTAGTPVHMYPGHVVAL